MAVPFPFQMVEHMTPPNAEIGHHIPEVVDALVIGAVMNTSAVAVWAIAQRLAELVQRVSNQLNDILFPAVVENDTAARLDRLQRIFLQGTKLSLATVVPLGCALIMLARPLVFAWVGPEFEGSVLILQVLAAVVIVRVGNATGMTLLKGAGSHRIVSVTNMGTAKRAENMSTKGRRSRAIRASSSS